MVSESDEILINKIRMIRKSFVVDSRTGRAIDTDLRDFGVFRDRSSREKGVSTQESDSDSDSDD